MKIFQLECSCCDDIKGFLGLRAYLKSRFFSPAVIHTPPTNKGYASSEFRRNRRWPTGRYNGICIWGQHERVRQRPRYWKRGMHGDELREKTNERIDIRKMVRVYEGFWGNYSIYALEISTVLGFIKGSLSSDANIDGNVKVIVDS